ncbi:MAG: MMPL family transporter [Syntrophobacteraceae bacterium]
MSAPIRFLNWWTAQVLSKPRLVLCVVLISCVLSLYTTATRLHIVTDQLELISANHPLIALSDRLDIFKSNRSSFTVIVDSSDPDRSIAFATMLTERLQREPAHFREVISHIDPDALKQWSLLYLDKQDIRQLGETLKYHASLLKSLATNQDLLNFLKLVNQEMASKVVGELFTGFLDEPAAAKTEKTREETFDLSFLKTILHDLLKHLNGSTQFTSPWPSLLQTGSGELEREGYFWEGKQRYLMVFVYPQESAKRQNEALRRLREIVGEVRSQFPDVAAGVTGQEAINNDEIGMVMKDMTRATFLALGCILALMVFLMRGIRRPVCEMVCLLVGLSWTFGFTTVFIGHLTILSVVFAPLLCGLGVDYGIHWFARYEEELLNHPADPELVVKAVTERSGTGILIAGCSAALSFLPFVLTGFRGLVELGLITGIGLLLILFSTFTVLPALSVLVSQPRPKWRSAMASASPRDLIRLTPKGRRTILVTTLLLSVLFLWSALKVHFDLNPLRLQAESAESVVWEKSLIANSERSVLSAATLASSIDEVSTKTRAFLRLPSVSEVESIFTLLPKDQEEKIGLLRGLVPLLPEIKPSVLQNKPADLAEVLKILERIGFKMRPDTAATQGADKKLSDDMAQIRRLIDEINTVTQKRPDALERFFEYRRQFRDDLLQTWGTLRKGLTTSPMGIENLPQAVREWFFNDGKFLLRIYPKDSIWEKGALTRFVNDLQSADKSVVGDPVSLYTFAFAFRDASIKASAYSIIAVLILLLATLRRISHSLLALSPLVFGTLWTVGVMGLVDIQFNLANSVFMPLIVGAGVEYGVIIIHRWREGNAEPGHLPLSTGKGVILAALTTTIGFGMLMISRHRGIFSLGFVAWTGSLCVLAAAILVLPTLLGALAPPRSAHHWRRY